MSCFLSYCRTPPLSPPMCTVIISTMCIHLSSRRPAVIKRKGVPLQQDGARPDSATVTCNNIKNQGGDLLLHPIYSPDIAPRDCHLFLSMQYFLDGQCFATRDDVERSLKHLFASKPPHFYRNGTQKLARRGEQVVAYNDYYILD